MGKGYRQGRLGEEIRKIISSMLLRELKDPRLSAMISITAVEVTSDGSYATVYLSVLGQDPSSETAKEQQQDVRMFHGFIYGFAVPKLRNFFRIRAVCPWSAAFRPSPRASGPLRPAGRPLFLQENRPENRKNKL